MGVKTKLLLIDTALKGLILIGVGLWIFIVYSLAVSGLPMLRQMLGCMLSTMAIFSALSITIKSLRNYRALLQNREI
jgi:hypothetical protein